jgi:hypothetical protein
VVKRRVRWKAAGITVGCQGIVMITSKPPEMRYRRNPYLGMIFIMSTLICPGPRIAERGTMCKMMRYWSEPLKTTMIAPKDGWAIVHRDVNRW